MFSNVDRLGQKKLLQSDHSLSFIIEHYGLFCLSKTQEIFEKLWQEAGVAHQGLLFEDNPMDNPEAKLICNGGTKLGNNTLIICKLECKEGSFFYNVIMTREKPFHGLNGIIIHNAMGVSKYHDKYMEDIFKKRLCSDKCIVDTLLCELYNETYLPCEKLWRVYGSLEIPTLNWGNDKCIFLFTPIK